MAKNRYVTDNKLALENYVLREKNANLEKSLRHHIEMLDDYRKECNDFRNTVINCAVCRFNNKTK